MKNVNLSVIFFVILPKISKGGIISKMMYCIKNGKGALFRGNKSV